MQNKSFSHNYRRLLAGLCLIATLALIAGPAGATCQFCWVTDAGFLGQCLDVLNPSNGLATMRNCVATMICYPYVGGEICIPGCLGDRCYWV